MLRSVVIPLLVTVAVVAIYHLVFHAGEEGTRPDPTAGAAAPGGAPGPRSERDDMARMLSDAGSLGSGAYDEAMMRQVVEDAGVALDEAQAGVILPALHEHLRALRANLEAALEAFDRGARPRERTPYRVKAVQQHGTFQALLREHLSPADAARLFKGSPNMLPPPPRAGS